MTKFTFENLAFNVIEVELYLVFTCNLNLQGTVEQIHTCYPLISTIDKGSNSWKLLAASTLNSPQLFVTDVEEITKRACRYRSPHIPHKLPHSYVLEESIVITLSAASSTLERSNRWL